MPGSRMRNHWFGPREFHPAQQDSNFAQFVERENFFAHFAAASNADKVTSAALCFCLRFPARSPRIGRGAAGAAGVADTRRAAAIHIYIFVSISIYLFVYLSICYIFKNIYVYIHTCVYIYRYIYIYIDIDIYPSPDTCSPRF